MTKVTVNVTVLCRSRVAACPLFLVARGIMDLPYARNGWADWNWVRTITVKIRRKMHVRIGAMKNCTEGGRSSKALHQ